MEITIEPCHLSAILSFVRIYHKTDSLLTILPRLISDTSFHLHCDLFNSDIGVSEHNDPKIGFQRSTRVYSYLITGFTIYIYFLLSL